MKKLILVLLITCPLHSAMAESDYKGLDFYGKKQIASYIHAENILRIVLDHDKQNYEDLKKENELLKKENDGLKNIIKFVDKSEPTALLK